MKLSELQKRLKKAKPKFDRRGSEGVKRLSKSWRRPKGLQNKQRIGFWGKGAKVEVGYRSPSALRGTIKGLFPVLIHNAAELAKVQKGQAALLSGKLGMKKKAALLAQAQSQGIALTGLDVEKYNKKVSLKLSQRKEATALRAKKKGAKKEAKPKPALTEKVAVEAEKEQKKKELDKVLTKRDVR